MKSLIPQKLWIILALSLFSIPISGQKWLQVQTPNYTIFYRAGYKKDAEFIRTWMDRTQQLMKTKYGVTPARYRISVYLLPAPADDIDTNQSGEDICCTRVSKGPSTGTIKLLTISAPIWKSANLESSLGLPKTGKDYHAKVLVSEYIPVGHYATQDSRPSGGWSYYSAPNWFVQGLQEYDAIFHSTDNNRTMTTKRLFAWAKDNPTQFRCCSPKLAISDDYNGGATFMAFLAEEFGEDIHARILRNSAPTFEAALAAETKPYSPVQLFDKFQKWIKTK
jgi:hypothetical protein